MARTLLSRELEAIEYRHASDGLPYRHQFGKGTTITLSPDGHTATLHNPRRRIWGLYGSNQQPFFENPQGERMKKKHNRRSSASSSTRSTTGKRRHAAHARRGAHAANPTTRKGVSMAHKKRSSSASRGRSAARSSTKTHHGHKHRGRGVAVVRRSNPPLDMRRIMNVAVQGVKDGGIIFGAEVAVALARQQFGYDPGSAIGCAIEAAVALAVGMITARFLGGRAGEFAVAGGMSRMTREVARSLLKNIAPTSAIASALAGTGNYNTTVMMPSADNVGDAVFDPATGTYRLPAYSALGDVDQPAALQPAFLSGVNDAVATGAAAGSNAYNYALYS